MTTLGADALAVGLIALAHLSTIVRVVAEGRATAGRRAIAKPEHAGG